MLQITCAVTKGILFPVENNVAPPFRTRRTIVILAFLNYGNSIPVAFLPCCSSFSKVMFSLISVYSWAASNNLEPSGEYLGGFIISHTCKI
jgi:hypothetical protein